MMEMRVTHVITRLVVGGAQENTIASVFGLRQIPGFEVNLVSGPTSGREGSLQSCFAEIPDLLTIVPELVRPVHPWNDLLALRKLIAIFRARTPEIVHTHSGKAGILGRIAASRAKIPIIIHTVHGPSFGAFQNSFANLVFRSAESYAAKVTLHFVVVAEAMKQQYLSAGIGRPDQYSRIFSGFPLEPFINAQNDTHLRSKLGFSADHIVIGKIGRLFKLKGHEDLLLIAPELIHKCPAVRFLFVGDGPFRKKLEHRVRSLGLQNHVRFAGLVPPDEVAKYVGVMDILVHLSLREGLPRALPQALAAARPVVAYDCDGAKEVCIDNETGFLLRPGDQRGLIDRLRQLSSDNALRRRLGECGQRLVREQFGLPRMISELQQLYIRMHAQLRPGEKPG